MRVFAANVANGVGISRVSDRRDLFLLCSSNTLNRLSTFAASLGCDILEPSSVGLVTLGTVAPLLRRRR